MKPLPRKTVQGHFYGPDEVIARRIDAQRRAYEKAGIDPRKAKANRRRWS